jgi:hypothetical protein
MVFETPKVSQDGTVLFVEIRAPPMIFWGPNWSAIWFSHSASRGGRGRQGARVQERRR